MGAADGKFGKKMYMGVNLASHPRRNTANLSQQRLRQNAGQLSKLDSTE